jgi:hypothetical protein
MNHTQIRESLTEVHDAVQVPPIDDEAFAGRVRRARRRRHARRAVVGATAVAAVAAAAVIVPHLVDRPTSPTVASAPDPGVPVVLGGHVQFLAPDGSLTDTGSAGIPIGRLRGREIVLDGDRLLGLHDHPVVEHVAAAFVDPTGATYQTSDGLITFVGRRGQRSATDEGTLLAAGEHAYAVETASGVVLHDAAGVHPVRLGSDGATSKVDRVEVGGRTVVVVADGGVQVFDTAGERRDGFLGGVTGALSGDGTTYAYAPSAREKAQGMVPGLTLYDTGTGAQHRIALSDAAVDLAWLDGRLYVVTQKGSTRTLLECGRRACEQRLSDPEGSLSLG